MGESLLLCSQAGGPRTPGTRLPAACGPYTASFRKIVTQGPGPLFEILDAEPVHVAVAGILQPNDASVALHRRFGFTDVGMFHEYAVKNGRHFSSLLLQRRC